eukprot:10669978-Prorocentrum_lima.AAC.1
MMKQQLKEIKELPPSTKQGGSQPEDLQVRTEELFAPLEVQEEVKKNFAQGFINPAAGLKSTPLTTKADAESRGEGML